MLRPLDVLSRWLRRSAGAGTSPLQDPSPAATQAADQRLVSLLRPARFPTFRQLRHLPKVLAPGERRRFGLLLGLAAASVAVLAGNYYLRHFTVVPVAGGEYVEGLVGAPRFVNPLLAQTNDVDVDLASLIFSGLLRYDADLTLQPDLAESYTVSEDGRTYTLTVRPDAQWHDGKPVTIDDVIFTYRSIQDPNFRSPLLVSLQGVRVERTGDRQVTFTLREPYPPFAEVLTTGILPQHLWLEIPPINATIAEYNLRPVGSGPWQFKTFTDDRLGNIKTYRLVPHPRYHGAKPYLQRLTFKLYPSFEVAIEALNSRGIRGLSYLPPENRDRVTTRAAATYSLKLPQYTAVFFNSRNHDALKNKNVRTALAAAIDRTKILTEVVRLNGEIVNSPILPGMPGYSPELAGVAYDVPRAARLLEAEGYRQLSAAESAALTASSTATSTPPVTDPPPYYRAKGSTILSLTLTTLDLAQHTAAAAIIRDAWQQIGVQVRLEILPDSRLIHEAIKPRDYAALLYGEIVGADPDPFPFWHSSQVADPGLNLALYSNRQTDSLLESARKISDPQERAEQYAKFAGAIAADVPAIFLYNPRYLYLVDREIRGVTLERINLPKDRFNGLSQWYRKTARQRQPAAEPVTNQESRITN